LTQWDFFQDHNEGISDTTVKWHWCTWFTSSFMAPWQYKRHLRRIPLS